VVTARRTVIARTRRAAAENLASIKAHRDQAQQEQARCAVERGGPVGEAARLPQDVEASRGEVCNLNKGGSQRCG
jgi:hypothetical protein